MLVGVQPPPWPSLGSEHWWSIPLASDSSPLVKNSVVVIPQVLSAPECRLLVAASFCTAAWGAAVRGVQLTALGVPAYTALAYAADRKVRGAR